MPADVEQALFSVTDVSFDVPNPHFPSISNGQVSVCTALEGPSLGTSDPQAREDLCRPEGLPTASVKDSGSVSSSCLQHGLTNHVSEEKYFQSKFLM